MHKPKNSETEWPTGDVPEAVVRTRRTFSLVWLVPLVAVIIGGWLVYKAMNEKGPTITVSFKHAEGLEAGKTKIKYKDVEIGIVESIVLSEDLSRVVVTAAMAKESDRFLTEKTRFWVVRARLAAGEVSGLRTLFSGAYIAIDPGTGGEPLKEFSGLERPPVVTTDLPGRHFKLRADQLGSLETGSPVYFRQIKVGQVDSYELREDGRGVNILVFIFEPYDAFIRKNTRFWNAGGVDITLDASGVRLQTQSMVTILLGGIAFDTPVNLESSEPVENEAVFPLYESYSASLQRTYNIKTYWILHFDGTVRGLAPGAPVEFRGIPIGQVKDVSLHLDENASGFKIPVLIEIEPERFMKNVAEVSETDRREFMEFMVSRGLRAQLRIVNLMTGRLVVDLNFYPDAPPRSIEWNGKYPELPTVQTPLEEFTASVGKVVDRLSAIPVEQISNDIHVALRSMTQTLQETQQLMTSFKTVGPEARTSLEQTRKTLAEIEKLLGADSPVNRETLRALEELSNAARAIRSLADYLERNPDSVIYGKGEDK